MDTTRRSLLAQRLRRKILVSVKRKRIFRASSLYFDKVGFSRRTGIARFD